jgi:hypothetical protein
MLQPFKLSIWLLRATSSDIPLLGRGKSVIAKRERRRIVGGVRARDPVRRTRYDIRRDAVKNPYRNLAKKIFVYEMYASRIGAIEAINRRRRWCRV